MDGENIPKEIHERIAYLGSSRNYLGWVIIRGLRFHSTYRLFLTEDEGSAEMVASFGFCFSTASITFDYYVTFQAKPLSFQCGIA